MGLISEKKGQHSRKTNPTQIIIEGSVMVRAARQVMIQCAVLSPLPLPFFPYPSP
jgi:hypothetical protein